MPTAVETTPMCTLCSTAMLRYPDCPSPDAAWFCETCDTAPPPVEEVD